MSTTYTQDQYDTCYPIGIEHHWWNIARSAVVSDLVCAARSSSDDVFLEVGCGRGLEVRALRAAGINVYGVELAEVQPLEGIEPYVTTGTDAVHLPLEQRDRVTGLLMLDVIEHLPDPVTFLAELQASYSKLSTVVLAVPASAELWSNYDEYYGHYRRYTTQMLHEVGSSLGWECRRSGYFFHLLYIPVRVLSLLGGSRTLVHHAPGRATRWLHRLIAWVNRLDYRLLPGKVRGTSAYAVFRLHSR